MADAYNTGGLGLYFVPSSYPTAMFVGDPVVPTGASDANGVPVVALATAGAANYILGPFVSIAPGGSNMAVLGVTRDMPVYHPASTSQYILVAHDPNELFWVQENSAGGSIAMATAGMKNANLVAGTGSTVTGYSGWQMASGSIAVGPTLQLRILRGLQQEDNVMADTNAKWLVKINLHSLLNPSGV
jgi:hypothetical protein